MTIVLGAAAMALAAASLASAQGPAVRSHPVSLVWTTISTDVGSGPNQEDLYRSLGPPSGRSTVRTEAVRNRNDRGFFDFTGRNPRGTWWGAFFVDKTYVVTTKRRQVIDYRGTGKLIDGSGTWRNARIGGRLTFRGRADCNQSGCVARFTITGTAVY